jgi:hypothetical protein
VFGLAGEPLFYNFSTSVSLPVGAYGKFRTYAHRHHHGEWSAAAHSLAQRGYGTMTAKAEPIAAPEPWPTPVPLPLRPQLPGFPLDVLPGWWGEWVSATTEEVQTPLDLPALLSLGVLAGGIARKVRVEPAPGWREPTNLFVVVVALPAERKSAIVTLVLRPVRHYQAECQAQVQPQRAVAEHQARRLDQRSKHLEQQLARQPNPAKQSDLQTLREERQRVVIPVVPVCVTEDETAESLGRLLAEQEGRMLVAGAEGTIFDLMKGRYSDAPNFDLYLKGHAGDDVNVGRISRERIALTDPALSVAVAVQPDVLHGLAQEPSLEGRGLLARFLYALPVSRVGQRSSQPTPKPAAVETAFHTQMLRLWRLDYAARPATGPQPHDLRLQPAARQALNAFRDWLEPQLAPEGALGAVSAWAGKLPGACVRIAAVLHCAESDTPGGRLPPTIAAATLNRSRSDHRRAQPIGLRGSMSQALLQRVADKAVYRKFC